MYNPGVHQSGFINPRLTQFMIYNWLGPAAHKASHHHNHDILSILAPDKDPHDAHPRNPWVKLICRRLLLCNWIEI